MRKSGCAKVLVDHGVKATAKSRPKLEKIKKLLKEGDIFVVWAIDRAFRSTIEAILFLDDLKTRGVEFQSLTQQIDTRTPEGRKWFIDTASWAEYERAIISRRTKEKMAEAKRRGQHIGRPFKLSKPRILKAHKLITHKGMELDEVAIRYDVSPVTLTRGFKRYRLEGEQPL